MGIKKTFRAAILDFVKWLDNDRETDNSASYSNKTASPVSSRGMVAKSSSNNFDDDNGLNFTIYNATGGKLVKVTTYDRQKDRVNSSLHIITDKEDLGNELAMIITRENLSR